MAWMHSPAEYGFKVYFLLYLVRDPLARTSVGLPQLGLCLPLLGR